jgi:hypothetical protein
MRIPGGIRCPFHRPGAVLFGVPIPFRAIRDCPERGFCRPTRAQCCAESQTRSHRTAKNEGWQQSARPSAFLRSRPLPTVPSSRVRGSPDEEQCAGATSDFSFWRMPRPGSTTKTALAMMRGSKPPDRLATLFAIQLDHALGPRGRLVTALMGAGSPSDRRDGDPLKGQRGLRSRPMGRRDPPGPDSATGPRIGLITASGVRAGATPGVRAGDSLADPNPSPGRNGYLVERKPPRSATRTAAI